MVAESEREKCKNCADFIEAHDISGGKKAGNSFHTKGKQRGEEMGREMGRERSFGLRESGGTRQNQKK